VAGVLSTFAGLVSLFNWVLAHQAAKAKYEGRRKLPKKDLPFSEMKEKENRPEQAARNAGGKKKKFANFDEDDDKPKIQYLPSDSD